MNTVWIAYVDTWTDGYGSSIYLLGVFDDEAKAVEARKTAEKEYESVFVNKVEVNKIYSLEPLVAAESMYLGGYTE